MPRRRTAHMAARSLSRRGTARITTAPPRKRAFLPHTALFALRPAWQARPSPARVSTAYPSALCTAPLFRRFHDKNNGAACVAMAWRFFARVATARDRARRRAGISDASAAPRRGALIMEEKEEGRRKAYSVHHRSCRQTHCLPLCGSSGEKENGRRSMAHSSRGSQRSLAFSGENDVCLYRLGRI